jgi:hypoxanthine phosphoribosyltransferase
MKDQINYSWEDFNKDVFLINSKLYKENWLPDCVVGIKRGGLTHAVVLSHFFKKPMYTITTHQNKNGSKIFDSYDIEKNLSGCDLTKILIVDDICDTGETFRQISEMNFYSSFRNIKFCSMFYNIRQNFIVDFYARKIDRYNDKSWIVFPWEA